MASREEKAGDYSNHPLWTVENKIWDILTRLHTIRQRAEVAQTQADNADLRYPDDSLDQIFREMEAQIKEIEEFRAELISLKDLVIRKIEEDVFGKSEGGNVVPFRKASNE